MQRLLETIELTRNTQEGGEVIGTDDRSPGHELQREPLVARYLTANTPLSRQAWHCSDYDF